MLSYAGKRQGQYEATSYLALGDTFLGLDIQTCTWTLELFNHEMTVKLEILPNPKKNKNKDAWWEIKKIRQAMVIEL